ncbi:MAG: hypothetical protein ABW039_07050 [Sphingobium sp.]
MGRLSAAMALAGLVCSAAPARAETPAQLDTLSRSAQQPGTGLTLARRQIRDGDLLGAMATLERVALNNPENREARLLHAGLLCRLDDRQGSLIEFDSLRGSEFSDALWAEATGACEEPREEASQP